LSKETIGLKFIVRHYYVSTSQKTLTGKLADKVAVIAATNAIDATDGSADAI